MSWSKTGMHCHYDEMNPDMKAIKIRNIQRKINNGMPLTDEEEYFYQSMKKPVYRM